MYTLTKGTIIVCESSETFQKRSFSFSFRRKIMDEEQYYEFLKAAAEQLTKQSSVEKPSAKESQKKTRYANKACVHCKSSHVACDSERPCKVMIMLLYS